MECAQMSTRRPWGAAATGEIMKESEGALFGEASGCLFAVIREIAPPHRAPQSEQFVYVQIEKRRILSDMGAR